MAQRILGDEERELQALFRRAADARQALEAHEAELIALDETQQEARAALAAERDQMRAQLDGGARRATPGRPTAALVLSRYERIRDRRQGPALFPLRGLAVAAATPRPLQRRTLMLDGSMIEVCEGCGVLLSRRALMLVGPARAGSCGRDAPAARPPRSPAGSRRWRPSRRRRGARRRTPAAARVCALLCRRCYPTPRPPSATCARASSSARPGGMRDLDAAVDRLERAVRAASS